MGELLGCGEAAGEIEMGNVPQRQAKATQTGRGDCLPKKVTFCYLIQR